ncbi:MAG: hypothetical protein ACRELY_27620, partial [Polyangiaceae bacterium]
MLRPARAVPVGLVLGVLLVSCGSQEKPAQGGAPRTAPDAVHVDGVVFRDGLGRQLLFRGYNIKVAPLFDVTFADGRAA